MTSENLSVLDEKLLKSARELVPMLSRTAIETDRRGRLDPDVVEALHDAGLLNLQAPRRFGGHEASTRTTLEVARELARGCGSTSWVSLLLSGTAFFVALLGEETGQEVWGSDPHAAICLSFAPTGTAESVSGGVRISGNWQPLSGIHEADWVMVGIMVRSGPDSAPRPALALVPAGAVSVHSTWDNAGMRGTSGDTVHADGVVVPHRRILSMPKAFSGEYALAFPVDSLYRTTLASFLPVTLMGPVLGLAEAALDTSLEILKRGKTIGGSTYRDAVDSPSVRFAMADAASLIDTARLHTYRALEDVERAHANGSRLDMPSRARVRMDVGVAASRAREAVNLLLNVGGARGFARSHPLQRIWRDVETAVRHPMLSADLNREVYANAFLGRQEQVSVIL